LIILSENDQVAREFHELVRSSYAWRKWMKLTQVTVHNLPNANHTFSSRVWRDQVAARTLDWVKALGR